MRKKGNKRIFLVTAMILYFLTGNQVYAANSGFYVPTGHQADTLINRDVGQSVYEEACYHFISLKHIIPAS